MIAGFPEYKLCQVLGEGGFAKVYKMKDTLGNVCAIKEMCRKKVKKANFDREVEVMKHLRHANIVEIMEAVCTDDAFYIRMEFCDSNNLWTCLYWEIDNKLQEAVCQTVFSQIANAVTYMHRRRITHFDLKPENILAHNNSPNGRVTETTIIKIADFGMAEQHPLSPNQRKGTPTYMAPEMYLEKDYGDTVDLWSLGTIFFECLFGTHPCGNLDRFDETALLEKWHREQHSELCFPEDHDVSEVCVNLLRGLLKPNPAMRITFLQLKEHSFFTRQ